MPQRKTVTLKQLRSLSTVLRVGSIAAASEELFLTAPAVSTQLKTLEGLIGAKLIERDGAGMHPTACGMELRDLYDRIDSLMVTSMDRIKALKSGKAGTVGVAVVSTGKYFAPMIMAAFMEAYADIELRLFIGNRDEVIKALKNRSVDMAIMGRPPEDRVTLETDYLGEHPHIIIAPPDHPLCAYSTTPAAKLLAQTFLMREEGSGTRTLAQRFLDQYGGGRAYKSIEMGTNESIKQAVIAGLGLAMISKHTVLAELEAGRLVALKAPGLPIMRKWILVRPSGEPIAAAAESFKAFLVQNRGRLIPHEVD